MFLSYKNQRTIKFKRNYNSLFFHLSNYRTKISSIQNFCASLLPFHFVSFVAKKVVRRRIMTVGIIKNIYENPYWGLHRYEHKSKFSKKHEQT